MKNDTMGDSGRHGGSGVLPAQITLDPGGTISGGPGSTIGWGYTINNTSVTDWLEPLNLVSSPFLGNLDPTAIFDYPAIAPGLTVTELFSTTTLTPGCSLLPCGLYDVMIPLGDPTESVTGSFTIQADYFNGNPNTTGTDVGVAPNLTANFVMDVVGSSTPEPFTVTMFLAGFLAICIYTRKRKGYFV